MAGVITETHQASDAPSAVVRSGSGPNPGKTASISAGAGRGYNPTVQDHFMAPRNVGSFAPGDRHVGTAIVGSRDQGALIRMQIRVSESGIISAICFKAYGCGATIAAASWVTEWAKGKCLEQISELHSAVLIQALSLPPVKTYCAMLAEDAIKAAVDHYMQRQE